MSTLRARGWDALVLVLVVSVLFEVLTTDQDVPLALSVPVGLAMTVPLLWGQQHPVPVVAVVLGAWLVQALAGDWEQEPQSQLLPVCVAFWCLGAYVARRRSRGPWRPPWSRWSCTEPDDASCSVRSWPGCTPPAG